MKGCVSEGEVPKLGLEEFFEKCEVLPRFLENERESLEVGE